jgi:hypothetical protein
VNGIEKAREKPNIPTIGFNPRPEAASTSIAPTIGPTHERLTITSVSAIKKEPIIPPFSALLSVFVDRLLGSIISKRPKNDAANTIKRIKKSVLGIQCDTSMLVKLAPTPVRETNSPIEV